MDNMSVLTAIDPTSLTIDQKIKALRAVNLIKQKRCGKVKGRMCANGAPYREFVIREEAKSPTISLEALTATMMIDAYDGRKITVFDVSGAYLQTDLPNDKFVLLKIENEFVDIMCEINEEYKKIVIEENGKFVLYLQVKKAIYCMIKSTLLWY